MRVLIIGSLAGELGQASRLFLLVENLDQIVPADDDRMNKNGNPHRD